MSSSRRTASRVLRGEDGRNATAATFRNDLLPFGRGREAASGDPVAQARAAGYEEGYRAARAELEAGDETSRAEQLARLVDALVAAAGEAATARAAALSIAGTDAVELAFELAEAIVQRELELASHVGSDAVRRALGLVPSGEDLVVRLHPGGLVTPEELAELVPDAVVKVVADVDVEVGGCIVEAGPCRVDAQIGPALRRAREVIESAGHSPAAVS